MVWTLNCLWEPQTVWDINSLEFQNMIAIYYRDNGDRDYKFILFGAARPSA